MPLKFKYLNSDYILIQLDEAPERTPGGIIIPDTVPKPVRSGTVLLVGKGRQFRDRYIPIDLSPGDHVYFFIASADLKAGQAYRAKLEKDQVFLREQDVLFEGPVGLRVEV